MMQSEALSIPSTTNSDIKEVVRRLFFEDPALSIDEMARALEKARRPMARDTISAIRLEVRQAISNGHAGKAAVPPMIRRKNPFPPQVTVINQTPKEPFNPPRLVLTKPPEPPAPVLVKPVDPPAPTEQPEILTEEKRKFLDDWLLENPTASVGKAREALIEKFGSALGTTYINERVHLAHELSKPVEKPAEKPHQEVLISVQDSKLMEIADIAHAMRKLGVKKIEMQGLAYIFDMID